MIISMYNEDCFDRMKKLSDDSVNLIFTSPPYNMNLRIRNGKHCSRQIVKELSTKYKNYPDNLLMEEYFDFNVRVLDECMRVSPLVFYNVQFLTGNKSALFKIIGKYSDQLKEVIVWDKVNAQPAIGAGVLNSQCEVILVFDRDNAISRKFSQAMFGRGELSNVWRIKRGKKIHKDHGAVFPLELAEKVISNFTKKGDVVLDPLMGTGTTGVACMNVRRNFIGIELDPDYYALAKNRVK